MLEFDGFRRFQCEIVLRHLAIRSYRSGGCRLPGSFHPCRIVSLRPCLPIHRLSNLKPRLILPCLERKRVRIGRWSEPHRRKYSTFMWEKIWCQSSLPTARSNLHCTLPELLFPTQESGFPFAGKSFIPQFANIDLKGMNDVSCLLLQPFFSW